MWPISAIASPPAAVKCDATLFRIRCWWNRPRGIDLCLHFGGLENVHIPSFSETEAEVVFSIWVLAKSYKLSPPQLVRTWQITQRPEFSGGPPPYPSPAQLCTCRGRWMRKLASMARNKCRAAEGGDQTMRTINSCTGNTTRASDPAAGNFSRSEWHQHDAGWRRNFDRSADRSQGSHFGINSQHSDVITGHVRAQE